MLISTNTLLWLAIVATPVPAPQDTVTDTATDDATDPGPVVVAGGQDTWQFSVTPYIWMMGMDGDLRVDDTTVDVDVSFDDLFDQIDLAFMARIEALKGKLGLYVDPLYSKLEVDGDSPGGDVDVTTQMVLVDFGLFYRLHDNLSAKGRNTIADVTLGGRYFYLKNEIDFPVLADVDGSTDFIDLTVGGRYGAELGERFGFILSGDIGGFGIGSSSEFAWNAMGLGFMNVGKRGRLLAGYRYLYSDRDEGGSTGVEMAFSGPIVGYEFRL